MRTAKYTGRFKRISVMDRVGWVDRNPQQIIAEGIEAKSKNPPQYQAAADSDVRFLLVANDIQNSGKLCLNDKHRFNLHGFKAVYLFPYPEDVVTLSAHQTNGISL